MRNALAPTAFQLFSLVLLLTGLAACSPKAEDAPDRGRTQQATGLWPDEPSFKYMRLAPTSEYKIVAKKEFSCIQKCFPHHFQAGTTTSRSTIEGAKRSLEAKALEKLVESFKTVHSIQADDVGVKFHYGLSVQDPGPSPKYHLEYAVQLTVLKQRGNSAMYFDVSIPEDALHPIGSSGKFGSAVQESDWATHQGSVYLQHVVIKRDQNDAWDELVSGSDHTSYLFKWNDIAALMSNNHTNAFLNLNAIAGPAIRTKFLEDDWHHALSLCTSTALGDANAVDDVDYGSGSLRMRALDLGSPCPPSCVLAKFYRYGIAPAETCSCP